MKKTKRAFSILELILAVGLFAIFALSIAAAVFVASKASQKSLQMQIAQQFAVEGIEAARALRSQSFDSLANTEGSGIKFADGEWRLDGTQDNWQGFARFITIKSAKRDNEGNILLTGDNDDGDIKLITSTVTQGDMTVEFSAYLSRREIIAPPAP